MRESQSKQKFNSDFFIKIGFYLISFFVLFNFIVFTLYLINANTDFKIFNHAYIEAITPDQDINNILKTGIVKINNIENIDLNEENYIIIYGDFNQEVNWVEKIVSIDDDSITVTYDNVISTTISKDEVIGVYSNNANFIGILLYFSSFVQSYLLLVILDIILMIVYYYYLVKRNDISIYYR